MPAHAAANQALPLECKLTLPASGKAGSPVELGFELISHDKRTLWVLGWNTPLEGLRNVFLRVSRDGEEVPYVGPMFKRGNPAREAYRQIRPGGSLHASVELGLAYDLSKPGVYRVEWAGKLFDVIAAPKRPPRPLSQHQMQALECASVEVRLN
ncbi:hypothetical protein [Parachitinimonas caeni]|uniref:hypothetical protein n=1 Tax=Parachitinimonas caeni TaxID=3031301 RepID=UPI0024DEEA8C|nr:hypothetical protein [Parachitinimonas caeni]